MKHTNYKSWVFPTSKKGTIGSLNTRTTFPSLQPRNHKLYRLMSASARNTHSRTKARSYSRTYEINNSTRYAMLLSKNTQLVSTATQEPLGIKNFYKLSLTLLLKDNTVFSISTTSIDVRPIQ
jgi:hypothetical protein